MVIFAIDKLLFMKKILLSAVVAFLLLHSCGGSKQRVFESGAKEFTAQCPMMINDNTRADSAVYTKADNTMRYYYALVGPVDNPEVAAGIKKGLDQTFAAAIKATDDLKLYKDGKVTIEYIYRSATTEKEFFRVAITPDMYQ